MIRAVFCDADDTLLTRAKTMTEQTAEAIRACQVRGLLFAVVSGRHPAGIRFFLRPYGIRAAMAACGGALILDRDGRPLHTSGMSRETADDVCRLASKLGFDAVPNLYTSAHWMTPAPDDPRVHQEAEEVGDRPLRGTAMDLPVGTKVCKLLFICREVELTALCDALRHAFPALNILPSAPTLLEVNEPGVSKGTAVRRLCEAHGIDPKDAMAIGDQMNDLEMLRCVGHPVLMANAPVPLREGLRGLAQLTADCDADGAGLAIRRALASNENEGEERD